jgi:hypothetical protein
MCFRYGLMYYDYLNELASHGYFVIAPGKTFNLAMIFPTTYYWQVKTVEWAKAWKDAPFKIDSKNIAVAGHSCRGVESITNMAGVEKKVIKTGELHNTGGAATVTGLNFKVPTLWVNGGPVDVAYWPSEAAFKYFAANKPELRRSRYVTLRYKTIADGLQGGLRNGTPRHLLQHERRPIFRDD